ncbi:MAG TPA: NifU family protein [Blastocatellia bacterium]|nr:NifU family protein [Blastocatellia bacterium]
MEEREFQQRIQKIEALVRKVEGLADAEARANALELFQLVMDLHGAGVERMMNVVYEAGEPGRAIIDKLGQDELAGSLLLLYGLHPLDLETRVMQALDKLRPDLRSHGARAELLGVREGVVRLRLEQSAGGCGSSAQSLRAALEEAIYTAAPDITALEVEVGVAQPFASGLVQLVGASSKG